jgi:serine/threonine-protein kinase
VLIQAADALAAAHDAGLVHRDVKPGNMMITTAGRLKLTDFGIAGASGAPCTDNGEVVGTARYMSPEQATGGVPSPRSDVYSLAVVGYELLAGHPPFDGLPAAVALAHVRNAPAKLPGDVPSGLADLIHRALAKDPSRRPADGHDFAAALRRLPDVNTATGVIAPVAPGTGAGHRAVALDATERQPTIRRAAPAPTTPMAAAPPALVGLREIAARPRRRRIVTLIAAASVAVLVIAAIVAGLRRSPDLQDLASTRETTAPTTAPPAPTVTVTAEALVGRPLSEVRETLQSEGLQVTVTPESGAADPTAVVVDVSPTGPIAVGATVLVTVEAAPPSTTASPATAPPAPPAKPAPAGGKGHGKGKGKG